MKGTNSRLEETHTVETTVLDVQDLNVHFDNEAGALHAVRGLNFSLEAGESLAVVGESG